MRAYYLGTHRDLLDPVSLRYLRFGALWYEEHGQRLVVGYGFGESKIEILRQFGAQASCQACMDMEIVHEIYQKIRKQQQEQDWSEHRQLPLLSAFKKPWRNMSSGWYVLKFQKSFPVHLSIVHKTKYTVWIEHSAVCENEAEIQCCIEKAAAAHHIDLKWVEGWGGKRNG
ncbi:hypothetical protein ACFQ3W_13670 [Paenibacillus puldeungensis]|uniref:Uncharacterized protein n=1 Tax=Paenibacillus puldeungensis TaxID=696536 RepID=A0ABW3RY21_9BACL